MAAPEFNWQSWDHLWVFRFFFYEGENVLLALAPLLLAGSEVQKQKYAGMLAAEPVIAV